MEDNTTTVTMSLKRFKELESFEKAFEEMKKDTGKFIWYTGYHGDYLVEVSNEPNKQLLEELKIAVEFRDNTISKVREYENRTGKKVFQY